MSIGELLNQRLSHQELLDAVLDVLISTTNADVGSILLMDYENNRLEFSAASGPASEALRNYHLNEGEGVVGHVARTGEPLLLPDPAKDPRFLGQLAEQLGYPVSSLICVPLVKNECVVGAVEILNNRKGAFEEKHLQLLEAAMPQVLLVLENHRLRTDMEKRLDELQALVQVGKVVNSSMNLDEVLGIALDRARWIMRAEAASIFLLDDEKEELKVVSARGGASEEIQRFRLPAGRGIAGAVVSEGKTLLVADVSRDERFFGGFDEKTKFQTRSILCAPLRAKGKVFGALEVINRIDMSGFSEGDRPLLEAFAEQSAVAIHNAQLNDKMEEMFINSIAAFAEAVDARDSYTAGHSTRVAHYADSLTKLLGLDEAEREQIHVAALLHDVGKIGIPDAILNKTERLDFDEFSLMKLHPPNWLRDSLSHRTVSCRHLGDHSSSSRTL